MATTLMNSKEVNSAISEVMAGIAGEMKQDEHYSKNPEKIEYVDVQSKFAMNLVTFCLDPEIQPKNLENFLEFTKKWMEAEESGK